MGTHKQYKARRLELTIKQQNKCYYCGVKMLGPVSQLDQSVTLDHVRPNFGGKRNKYSDTGKAVACCRECNTKRGHTSFHKFLFNSKANLYNWLDVVKMSTSPTRHTVLS